MIATLIALAAAAAQPAIPLAGPAFEEAIVRMHDAERAEVGSAPIAWDADLARDAAEWAAHLSRIDDLVHWSDATGGDNGQGENLWMGTRGYYGLAHMVSGWSSEKRPLARMTSWEQDHHKVGHYTQMVWSDTRRVGCAVSSNRENDFLVCRYWPAGNVLGEQPYATPRRQYASVGTRPNCGGGSEDDPCS